LRFADVWHASSLRGRGGVHFGQLPLDELPHASLRGWGDIFQARLLDEDAIHLRLRYRCVALQFGHKVRNRYTQRRREIPNDVNGDALPASFEISN